MAKRDEPFRPEQIEEQLDHLCVQAASRSTKPTESETRLVQDLHRMYADDALSGERVWERLAKRLEEHHAPAHQLRMLINHSGPKERKGIQSMDLNTIQSQPDASPCKTRRRLSLLAAVLVAAALVGSAMLTFTAIRAPQNTRVAGPSQTSLPSSSIKKVAAQDCVPIGDPAWDTTCHAGLVQALNQSQKLSVGRIFAIKGVYADRSQVAVWYSITPASSLEDMNTSITLAAQGNDLPSLGKIGSMSHSPTTIQVVARFDTRSLSESLQTVQLRLTSQVLAIVPGQRPKWSNASFLFSTQLAASRVMVLSPPQAVTANGITLTLKRISLSHLGTGFVLASSKPLGNMTANESVEIPYSRLAAGSVWLDSRKSTGSSFSDLTANGNKHFIIGVAFFFDKDLTDQHGSWTFTVSVPGQSQSWVFHVTA